MSESGFVVRAYDPDVPACKCTKTAFSIQPGMYKAQTVVKYSVYLEKSTTEHWLKTDDGPGGVKEVREVYSSDPKAETVMVLPIPEENLPQLMALCRTEPYFKEGGK